MDEKNQQETPQTKNTTSTDQQNNPETITSYDTPTSPAVNAPANEQGAASSKASKKPYVILVIVIVIIMAIAATAIALLSVRVDDSQPTAVQQPISLLRLAIDEPPLNTAYPQSGPTESETFMNTNLFDTLVAYEDRNRIVPSLATTWSNDNETTWRFTLKENVQMHNGKTLTAEMVKNSLENPSEYAKSVYASSIKAIEVEGNQIVITTNEPDATLLNKLYFLPIYDYEAFAQDGAIIGSGPYMYKDAATITETNVSLVAFANYHNGEPSVKELNVQVIPDTQDLVEAYKNNQIDAGIVDLSYSELDNIPDADVQKIKVDTHGVLHIVLNSNREGPLQDVRVRQALRYAVDAPTIIELRDVNGEPISQLSPALIPGHNPNIQPVERNEVMAKDLLAQAGYANGLTLEMLYYTPGKALAEELKNQFATIGVTLNLRESSEISELSQIAYGGQTDMFTITWSSDILDSVDSYTQHYIATQNYSNPTIESLVNQANSTFDQQARLLKLQEVAQLAFDDVATIPIYNTGSIYIIAKPDYRASVDLPIRSGVRWETVYSASSTE